MKKSVTKLIGTALSIAMVSALAACGAPASSSSAPNSTADSSTPASQASSAPAVNTGEKLIIYSNSASDGRAEWITERASQDGFNIEVVGISGGDLYNRIVAEKNNQIADVVFGLNPLEYEKFKKENLLLQYTPVWASEVDMTLGDADGYYHPIVIQPLVMAYNTDVFTKDTAPKDWSDLATNPAFAGKYTVLGTWGGTSRNIISSILLQYLDPNGTHGVSDAGWEVIKAYIQNGVMEVQGEDFYTAAINGTMPITGIWGSGFVQKNQAAGAKNMDFVVPSHGVPYTTEQIALFAGSKKLDTAKAFADWFGTALIQGEWAAKFGTVPAHPDAMKMAAPEVQDMMTRVKPQDMDWAFIGDNVEKWIEKIELEFVK